MCPFSFVVAVGGLCLLSQVIPKTVRDGKVQVSLALSPTSNLRPLVRLDQGKEEEDSEGDSGEGGLTGGHWEGGAWGGLLSWSSEREGRPNAGLSWRGPTS